MNQETKEDVTLWARSFNKGAVKRFEGEKIPDDALRAIQKVLQVKHMVIELVDKYGERSI